MKRKNNDNRKFIVSLFIIILSLGVGYAIFSETINITGTAQTTGSFDIEFFEAASARLNKAGTLLENTAEISMDKNTLTLNVPNLETINSWVEFDITVKNVGTIAALLESVDVTGDNDPNIRVTYPTWSAGIELAAGATETFTIRVEWITTGNDGENYTGQETLAFTVALNYLQNY
jgi:hypothetical protein